MKELYVLYDSHCGLCTEVRDWLRVQPAWVDLHLLASDSDEARGKFSNLAAGELAVVSDRGDVWLGDHAFIMCLWALRDYRYWAKRLASPLLRPLARQGFELVSRNRRHVSDLLGLKSEAQLRESLQEVSVPACRTQ